MKKIVLLMMLVLSFLGLSSVNASTTYTVNYSGVPTGYSGDFQVAYATQEVTYNSTDFSIRYEKTSRTSLTISAYYYSSGWVTDNSLPYATEAPTYCIRPLEIEGYDATVTRYRSTFTVTYTRSSVVKWHDDIFEYSTRHTQATSDVQNLTNNEVSISLWMGRNDTQFEEITDTVNAFLPLWWSPTVGEEQTLPDYGNKDINATATYKYLGILPNATPGSGYFFYERTHTVPISTVTEVEIPDEVTYNGTTYKVTAIQKWGFSYLASDCNPRYVCDADEYDQWKKQTEKYLIDNELAQYDYGNINDHRNDYLVTVRFKSPSNITQIGDYAFMSNKKLKSIIVPNSVENLGQGIWECCRALTDVRFQTTTITKDGKTYEGVKFDKIKNFTFWYCTALQTLVLPDGITDIEGAAIGAPLQYMFSLIDLKLPNTLVNIGAHFVCCCTSLETLTIPASVASIDGACFHGCEKLSSVYLLGPASILKAAYGEGDNTFGENTVFCKDHVTDCTFYTTPDYVDSYAGNDVWSEIAENVDDNGYLVGEDGRIKNNNGQDVQPEPRDDDTPYGNSLMVLTGEYRLFEDGKWITCCFPMQINNYKTEGVFGSKAIAAIMVDGVNPDNGQPYTYAVNDNPYYYHVSFKEIETPYIPANTPILLLPRHAETTDGKTYVEMLPNIHMLSAEQKANLTVPHTTSAEASFTNTNEVANIKMIGKYIRQRMNPGDFYFVSSGNITPEGGEPVEIGQFKKVVDQAKAPYINAFRCYWQVDIDNVRDIQPSKMGMLYHAKRNGSVVSEDGGFVDGINQTEKDVKIAVDIYDINGRRVDVEQGSLPKGLYISNGKKIVIK